MFTPMLHCEKHKIIVVLPWLQGRVAGTATTAEAVPLLWAIKL